MRSIVTMAIVREQSTRNWHSSARGILSLTEDLVDPPGLRMSTEAPTVIWFVYFLVHVKIIVYWNKSIRFKQISANFRFLEKISPSFLFLKRFRLVTIWWSKHKTSLNKLHHTKINLSKHSRKISYGVLNFLFLIQIFKKT